MGLFSFLFGDSDTNVNVSQAVSTVQQTDLSVQVSPTTNISTRVNIPLSGVENRLRYIYARLGYLSDLGKLNYLGNLSGIKEELVNISDYLENPSVDLNLENIEIDKIKKEFVAFAIIAAVFFTIITR